MLAEAVADQVQCDGIDAGIEERQTETDDAEVMPEIIVGIMGVRMEVEPHEEHVIWKEANGEEDHERQDHFHYFDPRSQLLWLVVVLLKKNTTC